MQMCPIQASRCLSASKAPARWPPFTPSGTSTFWENLREIVYIIIHCGYLQNHNKVDQFEKFDRMLLRIPFVALHTLHKFGYFE